MGPLSPPCFVPEPGWPWASSLISRELRHAPGWMEPGSIPARQCLGMIRDNRP